MTSVGVAIAVDEVVVVVVSVKNSDTSEVVVRIDVVVTNNVVSVLVVMIVLMTLVVPPVAIEVGVVVLRRRGLETGSAQLINHACHLHSARWCSQYNLCLRDGRGGSWCYSECVRSSSLETCAYSTDIGFALSDQAAEGRLL